MTAKRTWRDWREKKNLRFPEKEFPQQDHFCQVGFSSCFVLFKPKPEFTFYSKEMINNTFWVLFLDVFNLSRLIDNWNCFHVGCDSSNKQTLFLFSVAWVDQRTSTQIRGLGEDRVVPAVQTRKGKVLGIRAMKNSLPNMPKQLLVNVACGLLHFTSPSSKPAEPNADWARFWNPSSIYSWPSPAAWFPRWERGRPSCWNDLGWFLHHWKPLEKKFKDCFPTGGGQGWCHTPAIRALGRRKKKVGCKFIVSSMPDRNL